METERKIKSTILSYAKMSESGKPSRGALKLKGMDIKKKGIKKKKKKTAKETAETPLIETEFKDEEDVDENIIDGKKVVTSTLTAAQSAHEELRARRNREMLEKKYAKTHLKRLEEFNKKLADLPEHYDIPKVGPG
mmetsp:Transcript_64580/g.74173  ORF Transcript_64580/g.74173 Transcript_64580/m.74173 type:complete len:136 (-) Transcript_64580:128-535(-)